MAAPPPPHRRAAFFDLDKTVIAKASMAAFGRPFYREGLISRAVVVRSLYAQLVYLHLGADEEKLARIKQSVLALTRGWDAARVAAIVAETLEEVIEPIIYAEALELLDEHKRAGDDVYLVSASPVELVEPLGRYLGVSRVIASRAGVDEAGRYTGTMEFWAYGPHKADAIREVAAAEGYDLGACAAYSDSVTDLPMLEVVGRPVVVNPDRDLARVAAERGWEVRTFEHPVPLRSRVPLPPLVPTAAGSAVLAAAVGAGVWWRVRRRAS